MESELNTDGGINKKGILIGIAVGAALGIGIALSRRGKTRWTPAREMTWQMDAGELWSQGRELVAH